MTRAFAAAAMSWCRAGSACRALSALGAASALIYAAPAAANPACSPSARVTGDAALAEEVVTELAILGVRGREIPAGCPAVDVTVTRAAAGVAVAITDPAGHHQRAMVSNAHIAASWIESWVHPEISAPLLTARSSAPDLAQRTGQRPEATAAAPRFTPPGEADQSISARAPARSGGRLPYRGLRLAAEADWLSADDSSDWRALAVSACARLGPLCAGLVGRVGDNRGFSDNDGLSQVDRTTAELMAEVAIPIELGEMQLSPSAAVGLGMVHTTRGQGTDCPTDPAAPVCTAPVKIDDGFTATGVGARIDVGLAASFAISAHVRLLISGSIDLAPMARSQPAVPAGAPAQDNCPDPNVPEPDGTLCVPAAAYPLPREPGRMERLGVGLVVEVP